MQKRLKPIPKFNSEAEERAFWESPENDSTDFVDWDNAKLTIPPRLEPSTETNRLNRSEEEKAKLNEHSSSDAIQFRARISP